MTDRERFRRIMAYEPVDRLPVMALEPFEPEALDRWQSEGLPEGAEVVDHLGMARLRHAYTGGAAMGPDHFRFFHALGVNLKQIYGQT